MSHSPATDAAPGPRESYLGQREGKLTLISIVAMLALVLAYVGFMRAGHVASFGGFLPAELADSGGSVYSASCASCHGGTGGGTGNIPGFTGGGAATTFPDPIDQVRWVILGAADPAGAALYTAAGKTATGAMPAWGTNGALTLTEIVHVVLYERYEIGGLPVAPEAEAWQGLSALLEEFPDLGYTQADVDALLAEIDAAAAAEA